MNTQIIEDFAKALRNEEKSDATVEKYLRDVRYFAAFCGERTLDRELVIEYKKHLLDSGYAARSINSMLASLSSFFSFIGRPELRVRQLRVQQSVFCAEDKELTKAEYERLCRAAAAHKNERISLILQTICGTGIRVSELRFITAEAVRRGEATVSCKGKTRRVFLVKSLRKKLLKYIGSTGISTGPVFVTRSGKPISRTNVWREMKALCADANVCPEKVFPHNLRHLFARVFYAIEKDIAKLADILGHSSINTTRIYIISTGEEHRRRMEKMKLVI